MQVPFRITRWLLITLTVACAAQDRQAAMISTTAQVKTVPPGGGLETVRMTFTPSTTGGDLLHIVALGTGVQYSIVLPWWHNHTTLGMPDVAASLTKLFDLENQWRSHGL